MFLIIMGYLTGLFVKLFQFPMMRYLTIKEFEKDLSLKAFYKDHPKGTLYLITLVSLCICMLWPVFFSITIIKYTWDWFDPSKGVRL